VAVRVPVAVPVPCWVARTATAPHRGHQTDSGADAIP
jgi:hypothetical protein